MRHLTLRGRCFAAAGVTAVLAGSAVGARDFVRLGLLAVLVPLLSLAVVLATRRTARRFEAILRVGARQVEAGATARVEVEVRNRGRRTHPVVLDEALSPGLVGPGSLELGGLPAGGSETVAHDVRTTRRGRFALGPLRVRSTDPLLMATAETEIPATTTLLVTPRTEPLPRGALRGLPTGVGTSRAHEVLGGGSPDVAVREYRLGDDLRRVHWPTTARVSELMVRREEQEWQPRCTVVLDDRLVAHRGTGLDSSFERAVEVAASVVRVLADSDVDVRLLTGSGHGPAGGAAPAPGGPRGLRGAAAGWHVGSRAVALAEQLERLALVPTSRSGRLDDAWVHEPGQGGTVVAVLGRLDQADQALLAGVTAGGRSAYALVVGVDGWDGSAAGAGPDGSGGSDGSDGATLQLRRAGWRAATVRRGEPLAAAWTELGR